MNSYQRGDALANFAVVMGVGVEVTSGPDFVARPGFAGYTVKLTQQLRGDGPEQSVTQTFWVPLAQTAEQESST